MGNSLANKGRRLRQHTAWLETHFSRLIMLIAYGRAYRPILDRALTDRQTPALRSL